MEKESFSYQSHYPDYNRLSQTEQQLLCWLAYTGFDTDSDFKKAFRARFKVKNDDIGDDLKELIKKQLIVFYSDYRMWSSERKYKISPAHQLQVMCWMGEMHPEWKHKRVERESSAILVEMIADALLQGAVGQLDLSIDEEDQGEMADVLYYNANIPELAPLFAKLNNDMVDEVLYLAEEQFQLFALPEAIVDLHYLMQILSKPSDKKRTKQLQPFVEKCRLMDYICEGTYIDGSKEVPSSEEGWMLLALHTAYERHFSEAVTYMEKGLKCHNKLVRYGEEKNVFKDQVMNFFMMLLYALDGSLASKKKLETAIRKHTISDDVNGYPAYVLGNFFKDTSLTIQPNYLTRSLCASTGSRRNPETPILGFLLMNYLGVSVQQMAFSSYYKQPDLSPEKYIPTHALLRHELSPYLPICEEEKKCLDDLFGGEPLLASIYRKKEWEMVLDELLEIAEQEDRQEDTPDTRLVYVMSATGCYFDVREQRRLKDGSWGIGKSLNPTSYQRGNFEMESIDREIWEVTRSGYSMPSVAQALPRLVGCNRVILCNGTYGYRSGNVEPAVVREEKPFITVKREGKNIKLHTNLPSLALIDRQVAYYVNMNSNTVTYYPMTERERLYFRKLFGLKQIPVEAEEKLKKLFPAISNKVELHSDFIEGGTQLEQVDGGTITTIRVIPRGSDTYGISLFVCPLEGNVLSFVPGRGQNPAFGEKDGKRVQVMRHMKKETDNARIFTSYLEDMDYDLENYQTELDTLNLLEFMSFVAEHPKEGVLEWPEGEKVKLAHAKTDQWNVSLKKSAGWFELEGELSIDEHTVLTIAQLLDMLGDSRGRFIRLDSDTYLSISEQLRKQLNRLDAVSSRQRGKAVIPAVGMAILGEALNGELDIKHPKSLDDLRTKIRQSGRLTTEIPERLNATLRDYQVDGFQWLTRLAHWGAGACLADDMGLGKTLQTIAVLLDKAQNGPSLVVAPASVVPNWEKELHRFAPTLKVSVLNDAAERKELVEGAQSLDVIVSTYGLLVTEDELLTTKKWNVICLDEAHTIKNRDTKTSAAAMKLDGQQRIILTGTPIQNHLGELWNLFQFINPGLLGSYEQFQKKFIVPISQDHDSLRQQQLKRIVAPFMLRRTKQEVVEELPDKTEITHTVQLSEEEMAVYEVIRRKAKKELEDLTVSGKALNVNALAEITRLRQCACAVSLVEKGWSGGSVAKLDAFEQLASDIYQAGNRTLVFSQFTSFLELAAKRLDEQKIPYFYLDGSTPMRKRTKMVEEFQKGRCPIFLISLKAGGLGLNLTGANYVIHLDPWWNPAIEQQATDRAYRIGQHQNVTVYHLISANTIEEKILRLHDAKRNLATSLLEGTNTSHKISAAQLLEMIDEG